jgi:hypothetical protein
MNQSNTLHAVRIDTHRVTLMPEACADEGGVPHEPPLAKPSRVYRDDPTPRGYFWWLLVLLVDLVAAGGLLVLAVGPR